MSTISVIGVLVCVLGRGRLSDQPPRKQPCSVPVSSFLQASRDMTAATARLDRSWLRSRDGLKNKEARDADR
jgi:hypothetical protein